MASSLPISKVNLVAYFLATRLKNRALPPCYPQFIDYDVYSDHPFNILASTKQLRGVNDVDEGFFFSLNKINRCIKGHGRWIQTSKTHQVCIGKKVVGMEKYFKFKPVAGGSSIGNEDEWTMHEYYLDGNNEMVLCHITKVNNRHKKPDSADDDHRIVSNSLEGLWTEFDMNNTVEFDESMNCLSLYPAF